MNHQQVGLPQVPMQQGMQMHSNVVGKLYILDFTWSIPILPD